MRKQYPPKIVIWVTLTLVIVTTLVIASLALWDRFYPTTQQTTPVLSLNNPADAVNQTSIQITTKTTLVTTSTQAPSTKESTTETTPTPTTKPTTKSTTTKVTTEPKPTTIATTTLPPKSYVGLLWY
ncbi:MAG: hypothetical protein PHC86_09440, partial [Eubacteriales bacterium]|nr:hypothetical protein [Eubacteriales bacterium]